MGRPDEARAWHARGHAFADITRRSPGDASAAPAAGVLPRDAAALVEAARRNAGGHRTLIITYHRLVDDCDLERRRTIADRLHGIRGREQTRQIVAHIGIIVGHKYVRSRIRAGRIARNAAALGVPDLSVVEGSAPDALQDLPRPDAVFIGGIVSFVIGIALGIVLVYFCGWPILWLGLIGVLGSYFYTAAPLSLAYRGLGDFMVFALMGPGYVLGAYYVQTAHWSWDPFVVSLPIAFLVTAILHANNLRDIDDDRRHGKRTLATIIGRRPANWEYYLLIGAAYASLIVMVATRVAPWPVLISLLTLPAALQAVRFTARTHEPRKLNYVLFRTAQLHMRFGALLAAGLVAGLVVPH